MADRLRLFLFVLTAVRFGGDGKPGRHPVLAYSSAVSADAAIAQAEMEIAALGWHEVELEAAKEIPPDPTLEPDLIAREAIALAISTGFAQISY